MYLAERAVSNLSIRRNLQDLAKNSQELLKKRFIYTQKELEEELEEKGKLNLLKESSDIMTLDSWLHDETED
ncbi:MAG: hypothetical protein HWN65_02280 [Candidatus Helarchaeota archaeon]|nr:hypothetical protein [Candidatus Helarchaeota archaeon]